jgi:hypothetical protein
VQTYESLTIKGENVDGDIYAYPKNLKILGGLSKSYQKG